MRPHQRRRRVSIGWIASGVALLLVLVAAGVFLAFRPQPTLPTAAVAAPASPSPPEPVVGTLGKRRTFQDVLTALGVAKDRAIQIVQAMRPHIDFRRLRPEDRLELHRDATGEPVKFVYRQSPIDIVEAARSGDTWTASRLDVPVDRRVVVVSGTLRENLFESMERLGERPQLVLDFAEIFAWDFDFAADS